MATDPNTLNAGTALGTATLGTDTQPAPATLGATDAAPAAAADNPNVFAFVIPGTATEAVGDTPANAGTQIQIDIALIPAEVRMDFLKKGLRDYITNATNQAGQRAKKDNAPHDAYDEAVKADALQTAVAKPTGDRKVADLIGTAAAARKRLYDGDVRKQGEGTGTPRQTVDPLTKLVTEAVVRELHQKDKDAGGKRKYTEFTAEVAKAGGGVKYLDAKIADKLAGTAEKDRDALSKTLEAFKQERYIKPAQMMLGARTTKATDAANSIL